MDATATRTQTENPVMHYWGMVKDLDNNIKLELVEMLIESLKPVVAKAQMVSEEPEPRRLTMAEVNAMLDEAEANFAAGRGIPHEEVMRRWDEKIARRRKSHMQQEESLMADAV